MLNKLINLLNCVMLIVLVNGMLSFNKQLQDMETDNANTAEVILAEIGQIQPG